MDGTLTDFAFPSSKEVLNTVCVFNVKDLSALAVVFTSFNCFPHPSTLSKLSKHYSKELQLSPVSLCLKFLSYLMA